MAVPKSVAALLQAWAAASDNREVTEENVAAWAEQLADVVNSRDGQAAVSAHYATSTRFVMPADVNTIVQRIRNARIAAHPTSQPPASLDGDPARERAWIIARNHALGDGESLRDAEAIACRVVGTAPDPHVLYAAPRPPGLGVVPREEVDAS